MTKTNRGGSAVGRFGAGQQQAEVGLSYGGAGLSRTLQDMKEALGAARIPFNTRRFSRGTNRDPGPLFLCSLSQVFFWENIGDLREFFIEGVTATMKQHLP